LRGGARRRSSNTEAVLSEFLGEDQGAPTFWQNVKTNLQAGRVRLIFIADEIPPELRRVVEFLNGQMDPAEVLAVEVKQFVSENLKTLVPRVLGQTETARQKKSADRDEARQWDEASFFSDLSRRRGEQDAAVARRLLEWAKGNGLRISWGRGKQDGSFFPMYDNKYGKNFLFAVWSSGGVELQFQHMKQPPFSGEAERKGLAHRLTAIPGLSIPETALSRRPSFKLGLLSEDGNLKRFLEPFDWVLSETKKAETALQHAMGESPDVSNHGTPA
jgi:hypothetical protein